MDVRDDHAHSTHVERLLYKPDAALVRHPHEGGHPRRDGGDAHLRGVLDRHAGVLEVDEEGVVPGRLGDVHNLDAAADLDAEGGADLPGGGEADEVVLCDG